MYACILIVWTGVDAVLLVNVGLRYAQPVHVGRQEHGCVDPEDEPAQGLDVGATCQCCGGGCVWTSWCCSMTVSVV